MSTEGIIIQVHTSLGRGQQRDVDLVKIIAESECSQPVGKVLALVTDPKPNTYNSLPFTTEQRSVATRLFQTLRDTDYCPDKFQLHGYEQGDKHNTIHLDWNEPFKSYIGACCVSYTGEDPRMEGGLYQLMQCKLSEPIVGGL